MAPPLLRPYCNVYSHESKQSVNLYPRYSIDATPSLLAGHLRQSTLSITLLLLYVVVIQGISCTCPEFSGVAELKLALVWLLRVSSISSRIVYILPPKCLPYGLPR